MAVELVAEEIITVGEPVTVEGPSPRSNPHAIFDFEARHGYCRTGFPPADPDWTGFDHSWDDRAVELFG